MSCRHDCARCVAAQRQKPSQPEAVACEDFDTASGRAVAPEV
jgi:hypothetical protein